MDDTPISFELTVLRILDLAQRQPELLPRMTSQEGDWRKLFGFLVLNSEDPRALGLYLDATHDGSEEALRDVVETLMQARTVPRLFNRHYVVKALLDFSKRVESPKDQAGTLSVLARAELRKQIEQADNITETTILDMLIQHYGLATRNDLEWNSLRTDLCHAVIEQASIHARLVHERMRDSQRAAAYQEALRERLVHLLGAVVRQGGSLERKYQFEVYGSMKSYTGALDMAVALDRNLRAGHGVIAALLDVGADWTRIDLDTLRPDIKAVFDQHPSVRRDRLDKLAGGSHEVSERRWRM